MMLAVAVSLLAALMVGALVYSRQRARAVHGGACDTRTERHWKKNHDGVIRTASEVFEIANKFGLEVPIDLLFWVDPDLVKARPPTFARYGGFQSHQTVKWADFYGKKGKIPVRLRPDVLESDIAILAIVAHEVYELNKLRELFLERGTIGGEELGLLVSPNREKNLHWYAWEDADRRVLALLEKGSIP